MLNRRAFLDVFPPRPLDLSGYWLHINRSAMACRFEVTLPMSERAGIEAATTALDGIDQLEAQLTIFRESSELSFINRYAAERAVPVEPELFSLLLLCEKLHQDTNGAFDITAGPLTRSWGFLKREGRIPSSDEISAALAVVGANKVLLDTITATIRFARKGVEINLGSIGKGFALDQVGISMRRNVRSALLNAGASSMLAIGNGDRHQPGWEVGLRDPRDKHKRLALLWLGDCALSTSGSEEQFFEFEGRRYGHIIDPRSGWPADRVTSVSVVAPTASESDALATAFYVGGRELAEKYCQAHENVMAIMLERDSRQPTIFGSNPGCRFRGMNM